MTPDLINGLFEASGAVFLALNIRAIWRDKKLSGVHWAPTVFFTSWSTFNLWFYPSQGLWWSFMGGSVIAAANLVWLGSVWWFLSQKRAREGLSGPFSST